MRACIGLCEMSFFLENTVTNIPLKVHRSDSQHYMSDIQIFSHGFIILYGRVK